MSKQYVSKCLIMKDKEKILLYLSTKKITEEEYKIYFNEYSYKFLDVYKLYKYRKISLKEYFNLFSLMKSVNPSGFSKKTKYYKTESKQTVDRIYLDESYFEISFNQIRELLTISGWDYFIRRLSTISCITKKPKLFMQGVKEQVIDWEEVSKLNISGEYLLKYKQFVNWRKVLLHNKKITKKFLKEHKELFEKKDKITLYSYKNEEYRKFTLEEFKLVEDLFYIPEDIGYWKKYFDTDIMEYLDKNRQLLDSYQLKLPYGLTDDDLEKIRKFAYKLKEK